MEWLNEFFKNPTWIGFLAVLAVLIFMLVRDYMNKKTVKKDKEVQQKKDKQAGEKQETAYKTIDRLSDAVELLVANNTNKVNLMTAENIIEKTLNASKSIIKEEVRRVFEHNHRENAARQKIIKQSVANVTRSVYENDIKSLSMLYYKSKKLSEFLINIKTDNFFKDLLKLLFTTGGIADNELHDILMYVDSNFDMFILNGKKYYNNL